LSLLKQTLNVWRANCNTEFASLPVCSDDTVANVDDDVAVAHISDVGVPAKTDPEAIAAFLRQRSGPRAVFSTYQSSPRIAEAFTLGSVPAFDLVIADEAHRCAGPVSSDFATILDPVQIKAKRRLFMTATPRYFTGRVLKAAEAAEFEYASMDHPAKFGTVFHRLTFDEAIKRDLLTDYQVAIVGVDDATYREWAERGAFVTLDGVEVTDATTLAGQIGLAKAMRKYDLHRVISFHSRVKRAREFAASIPDVLEWMPARQRPKGALWSRYASGEMPAGDRYVLLQHLGTLDEGDRGLLANARCLSEGVDVPTLDGVAFIDPRRSEVDIVQAVGRAIRKSEDKTVGTIVIPVFIDTDADPEVALDSSVFKPVWDVIKALRAHDTELGEQLDALRRELARKGGRPRLPDKVHVDIPVKVSTDFARAFDVRLVEQTTQSWEFWFGLLEKYVTTHGTARVPFAYAAGEHKLGQWINAQRNAHVAGTISANKRAQLERLPGWTWNARRDMWEDGYAVLCRYVEEHRVARVPYECVYDGYKLGKWITAQRRMRTVGKLSRERQQRLSSLPGWTWDIVGDQWEEGYDHLVQFVDAQGSARVLASYVAEDGYNLGHWVHTQRAFQRTGVLIPQRKARLEALAGWTWNPKTTVWEEKFALLEDFVSENGHARVPTSYSFNGVQLGTWVATQRQRGAKGRLDPDQRSRLEKLPEWTWHRIDSLWEEAFTLLEEYVEREGTSLVPQAFSADSGFGLGSWVSAQRQKKSRGQLDKDKQRRLGGLLGWTWEVSTTRWDEGFSRLLEYVEHHGHARVPQDYKVDGYKLGHWVVNRRSDYRKGTLDAKRQRQLQGLPGWIWDSKAGQWEKGFTQLLRYVEQHGNALVPASYTVNGYRLGGWVLTQRISRIEGTIDADRQRRLDEVPGWSWAPKADQWEDGFARLLGYVERHGDARVPDSYMADGYALGAWVGTQRAAHRKGTLVPDRQQRLEELPGWTWVLFDDQWEDGLRRLQEYVECHGDADVPQSYKVDGYALGVWVTRQRRENNKGSLDAIRQRRLDEVRGWTWNPVGDKWERAFNRLQAYVKLHGDARVPDAYKTDGFALGAWVGIQRASHRKGILDPDRKRRLDSLPGWVWSAVST
jgi:Helicase associated domain/Helicase conserved C-terminal domain